MNLVRLSVYFVLAQSVVATCAFASPTQSVPEPATLAVLAVGAGGIALARKFRKRK